MPETPLSFSQSQGLAPLPQALKLGDVPALTRRKIDAVFQRSIRQAMSEEGYSYCVEDPWKTIIEDIQIELVGYSITDAALDTEEIAEIVQRYTRDTKYNEVFDFILFVLRHKKCPSDLLPSLQEIFQRDMLAYHLLKDPVTIVPASSKEEADTIMRAIEATSTDNFSGARTHLLAAANEINAANFHNSVRESIHAVESVARVLDGRSDKELGPALAALEKKVSLHGAFKKGISALYGYSSNEQGIRHALLDDDIKPDLNDALFMFGACAAFVTFMIGKARSAGILDTP